MKKIIVGLVAIFMLFMFASGLADDRIVTDGISLGMTKEEVVRTALSRNLSINSAGAYESTVAGQPFSVVNLFFLPGINQFSRARISPAQALANDVTNDLRIANSAKTEDKESLSAENEEKLVLAQICVTITSDYQYATATETYEDVEDQLSQQYGPTRYTKRRGEALPMLEGYGPFASFVITQDIDGKDLSGQPFLTVSDYSHRIIALGDGQYMIIDHHLAIKREFGDEHFQHRIVYSLIPVDLSDPSVVWDVAPQTTALLTPEPTPEPTPDMSADYALLERLRTFFACWAANRQDDMLILSSPTWAAGEENPKTALFALLQNRSPKNYAELSISGTTEDEKRTVTIVSSMDNYDGKDPVKYTIDVEMVKEADGLWYVNPKSLLSIVEYSPDSYVTEVPEQTATPAVYSNTILYYNPSGGEYYHLDQNCRRIAEKFLPLKGRFTYAELNDEKYKDLKPCAICGAPLRDFDEYDLSSQSSVVDEMPESQTADNKSLSDAEIAVYAFSAFVGQGKVVRTPAMSDKYTANTRMIIIGDKALGSDLVVTIRISDDAVYMWTLELTKDNLIKAKLALDENAPLCAVSLIENGVETKSAMYFSEYRALMSYEYFISEVDDIFRMVSDSNMSEQDIANDPVLSFFPEFSWTMTQQDMYEKYGYDSFSDVGRSEDGMTAKKDILGKETIILFAFNKGKLSEIALVGVGDTLDQLIDKYTGLYGNPVRASAIDAMLGNFSESEKADCYIWKAGNTYILIPDSSSMVRYMPLY